MKLERGLVSTATGYIHYRAAGAGTPSLLLHINQQSSALYDELIEQLAPRVRAIAFDYPGHGMSDHVAEQPSIDDYSRAATAVLDALGIDRAYLLGEAVGSAVAAQLAATRPNRVAGVILLNCPLTPDRGQIARVLDRAREIGRPADISGFPLTRTLDHLMTHESDFAPLAPSQSWMDRINLAQIQAGRDRWQASTALMAFDLRKALQGITCPALILTGEHCRFAAFRKDVSACVPHALSEVIGDARFCMGWEKAAEIARRAVEFIEPAARQAVGRRA
jgi:pimeloyl-ACP methyl ester carboxylesterase